MPNFIFGGGTLPVAKTDLTPIPGGADPTKWMQASDWNSIRSALLDTQGAFSAAAWLGFATNTSPPSSISGGMLLSATGGVGNLSQDGRPARRLFWDRDATEFGVVLNSATDTTSLNNNTAACQAALTWQYNQAQSGIPAKIIWPCGGAIRINGTLVQKGTSALSGANVSAIPGGTNFDGYCARFEWWGADNGTMWFTERCNKGIMEDLAFYGNDKAGCCVEYSATTFADRSVLAATSGFTTRRCRFVNLKPGVSGNACIKIGTDPALTGGGDDQFSEAAWYDCDFTGESSGASGFSWAGLAADAIKFMAPGNCKNFKFERINVTVANHLMNGFGSGFCSLTDFAVGDVKVGFNGGGTMEIKRGDFECGDTPDFKLITGGDFADRISLSSVEVFVGVLAGGDGKLVLINTAANIVLEDNIFGVAVAGDVSGTRVHFQIRSGGVESQNNLYLGFDDLPQAPLFDGNANPAYPLPIEYPRQTSSVIAGTGTFSSIGDRCSRGDGGDEIYMTDYTRGFEPERSILKLQDLNSDFGRAAGLHEGQNRTCFAAITMTYTQVKSRIQSSLFSEGVLFGWIAHTSVKRVWCEILTPFAGVTGVTCQIDTNATGDANIMAPCDPTQAAHTMLGVDATELGHLMSPGDPLFNPNGYYIKPSYDGSNAVRLSFSSPATALSSLSAGELLIFIEYSWFGHN